jgi:putative NADH-flavin reductase
MKLTIVAATGGIGRQILQQAIAAGHDVTAVVRNPAKVTADVRVVQADLSDPDTATLAAAMAGADAVLSGLGTNSRADEDVAAGGTQAIVTAMKAAGARRIIVVSAAPIGTVPSPGRPHPPKHDPGDNSLMRYLAGPVIKAALRGHYADLARMEDVLRGSGLDWTVVRPPRLTDKPATGRYRTAVGQNVHGGTTISRADVAGFMLALAARPETAGQVMAIAN